MRIGIPKENIFEEKRVAVAPAGVDALIRAGHTLYIESGAGDASNFSNQEYAQTGATIVYSPEEVYHRAEMVVKVSTLSDNEAELLQENQILFSFLHLAVGTKKRYRKITPKKYHCNWL